MQPLRISCNKLLLGIRMLNHLRASMMTAKTRLKCQSLAVFMIRKFCLTMISLYYYNWKKPSSGVSQNNRIEIRSIVEGTLNKKGNLTQKGKTIIMQI